MGTVVELLKELIFSSQETTGSTHEARHVLLGGRGHVISIGVDLGGQTVGLVLHHPDVGIEEVLVLFECNLSGSEGIAYRLPEVHIS